MTSYCSKYIPDYATITAPLRELTRKNSTWTWGPKHQGAFEKIKHSLADETVLSYFSPRLATELVVDANPVGLGAILAQSEDNAGDKPKRVIAFGSRALTSVEQRYSQTEREALAIVWAIERFHAPLPIRKQFQPSDRPQTSGTNLEQFEIEATCPHREMEPPIAALQLQSNVSYRQEQPGRLHVRHPDLQTPSTSSRQEKVAEQYINFLSAEATPKAVTLQEIKDVTKADRVLQRAVEALHTGQWTPAIHQTPAADKPALQALKRVQRELNTNSDDTLLLKGSQIILPATLEQRVPTLAHEGRQGVVKTKQLLREKVWFPGIDHKVQQTVKNYIPCQACTPEKSCEPVQMSKLPTQPWSEVSIDFSGPYPSGEYLLVVSDDYSRYPVVNIIHSTSNKTVIPHLDRIFAQFGIPCLVRTDNGPPFNSREFRLFAEYLGFTHRRDTPRWPQANGEVERLMRTLGKAIKTAKIQHGSWKQALFQFLRIYRATSHATTGESPAKLMFGRPIRTILLERPPTTTQDAGTRKRDEKRKQKIKKAADRGKHNVPQLAHGDKVIIRQERRNKLTPHYEPRPLKVITVKGSMITAARPTGEKITRNRSHFKLIPDTSKTTTPVTQIHGESDDEWPGGDRNEFPPVDDPAPSAQQEAPPERRGYSLRERRPRRHFMNDRYWSQRVDSSNNVNSATLIPRIAVG